MSNVVITLSLNQVPQNIINAITAHDAARELLLADPLAAADYFTDAFDATDAAGYTGGFEGAPIPSELTAYPALLSVYIDAQQRGRMAREAADCASWLDSLAA